MDPVNLTDPDGEIPALWTGLAGAVVGGIGAAISTNSCSKKGRALDVAIGAGIGFVSGFAAGMGFGYANNTFHLVARGALLSRAGVAIGGFGVSAGANASSLFMPNGSEILGCECK